MKKKIFPNKIPIFPLSSAIFFPRTVLPLNIFEDRYIQLVNDSMKENRMFGMVQPKSRNGISPEVYKIGCLGKMNIYDCKWNMWVQNQHPGIKIPAICMKIRPRHF